MIAVHSIRELRAVLRERPRLEIVAHRDRGHVGEIRRVTKSDYYSFYSVIDKNPRHPVSRLNYGKGELTNYVCRGYVEFHEGVCSIYERCVKHTPETLIIAFRFLEKQEQK